LGAETPDVIDTEVALEQMIVRTWYHQPLWLGADCGAAAEAKMAHSSSNRSNCSVRMGPGGLQAVGACR